MPSAPLPVLSVAFYLYTCLATSAGEDLFGFGQSSAKVLLRRARGGGGGFGSYYKSCQESYGSGFAECYGTCFNAGAGEKCCAGNYSCPNGQYCGFGSYSYCCYDYKTPAECAGQYAIAQPPPNWKPGDGNAPASVTNPPAAADTPTATPTDDNSANQPTAAGPNANAPSSSAGNINTLTTTSSPTSTSATDFSFTRQTLSTSDGSSGEPTTGFGGVSNATELGGDNTASTAATASQTDGQLTTPSSGSGDAPTGGADRVGQRGVVGGAVLAVLIAVVGGLGMAAGKL